MGRNASKPRGHRRIKPIRCEHCECITVPFSPAGRYCAECKRLKKCNICELRHDLPSTACQGCTALLRSIHDSGHGVKPGRKPQPTTSTEAK